LSASTGTSTFPESADNGGVQSMSKYPAYCEARPFSSTSSHQTLSLPMTPM
jgi:hypothetical protein